ncbi:MAG TPA: ferritin-like domain-containing protein [Turneriella sp.]|nr:ferritin-like domain-containing protein [Turneriella sp.]
MNKPVMEFFTALQNIRTESDLPRKLAALSELNEALASGAVQADHAAATEPIGAPSYAAICRIVHGSQVERRRNLGTAEGRAVFLHALAHIEYSAIDLALDSCYRFRHLPPQYYEDWLKVTFDETRHFVMLQKLLGQLGYHYGSFSVHTGIHDAMARSAHSLRQRMAATHRHLEANGLDAHPELARKMQLFDDPLAKQISAALKVIFDDEVTHVHAGDFWFRYACTLDEVGTGIFAEDVQHAIPGTRFPRPNLNREARLRAGFTSAELDALSG